WSIQVVNIRGALVSGNVQRFDFVRFEEARAERFDVSERGWRLHVRQFARGKSKFLREFFQVARGDDQVLAADRQDAPEPDALVSRLQQKTAGVILDSHFKQAI